jgi:hypothetical protein
MRRISKAKAVAQARFNAVPFLLRGIFSTRTAISITIAQCSERKSA